METVLASYDLPKRLKIPNPAGYFRRFGRSINQSDFVFPVSRAPYERFQQLRDRGASIRLYYFQEKSWEQIMADIVGAVRKQCKEDVRAVKEATREARKAIKTLGDDYLGSKDYRGWRAVLARARRELLAAEECAFGFEVGREVEDATDALRQALAASLDLALSLRG